MSKTITRKSDNVSVYLLHDDATVDLAATPSATVRGNTDGTDFDIGDLDSSNADLHSSVTAPSGWRGGKHTYDGSSWTEVDGWVDPAVAEIARLEAQIVELQATL
jgi:hypothetical protein